MRKFLISFFLILLFFIFPLHIFAQTDNLLIFDEQDYLVETFQSDISVLENTEVAVTETIKAKFNYPKHGIFRTIPYIYSADGRSINARIDVESVTDEDGDGYPYVTERVGQSIRLKIGDPNKTISGVHTYKIYYKLRGVILQYAGVPELYWNVTGNDWDTEIVRSEASVSSYYANPSEAKCYTGPTGSTTQDCNKNIAEKYATFTSGRIAPGSGFTIAVRFDPQNSLIFPGKAEKITTSLFDNWGYVTAVIPFIGISIFWYKKGRDQRFVGDNYYYKPDITKTETAPLFSRSNIPLVYHPLDGLTPAEVGTILDEKIDIQDVIAEIVEMARLKYVKIEKLPKKGLLSKQDYAIIKLKNDDTKLSEYQKEILKELFRKHIVHGSVLEIAKLIENPLEEEKEMKNMVGKDYVTLSSLKNHFYVALPPIKKKVYKSLTEKGLFDGNPETVRIKYIGGFLLSNIVFGFATMVHGINYFNFAPLVLELLLLVLGIFIATKMPKKTAWGYSMFKQSQGLREYLRIGKWRHEHYESKLFFEEVIPLAISLGVVNKLASDMADIGMEPPRYMGGFAMHTFARDLTSFQTAAASSFVSSPSSSGRSGWSGGSGFSGGSSGGGFGGGGGGSW